MRKRTILYLTILTTMLLLAGCGGNAADHHAEATAKPVVAKKLVFIAPPDKVTYEVGDLFDPAGTVIQAQMSDGTTEDNIDFEYDTHEPLTKANKAVVFSYKGKEIKQNISVLSKGNNERYSVANTEVLDERPLSEKTFLFLGSSVTAGTGSGGESMADFIAKRNNAVCIKKAVAGTTLADVENKSGKSYVARLEDYMNSPECAEQLDAFICQLSTNDRSNPELFGTVTGADVRDAQAFDRTTTFGALEYILAIVQEKWNCPVLVYTNPALDDPNYKEMVDTAYLLSEKWGFKVIDLFYDEDFNDIKEEERVLYMTDEIHPTKAGYREWWTPVFEKALAEVLETP